MCHWVWAAFIRMQGWAPSQCSFTSTLPSGLMSDWVLWFQKSCVLTMSGKRKMFKRHWWFDRLKLVCFQRQLMCTVHGKQFGPTHSWCRNLSAYNPLYWWHISLEICSSVYFYDRIFWTTSPDSFYHVLNHVVFAAYAAFLLISYVTAVKHQKQTRHFRW